MMSISKMDHIIDNLYLSGSIDNYDDLVYNCINMVINTRSEQHDDICELTKRNISYYYIPIGDYGAPRMDQIQQFLDLVEKNKDKTILVHCAVGRGRSAMLVGCYLVKNGMTPKDAVKYIQNLRPEVLLTDIQFEKLKRYYNEK